MKTYFIRVFSKNIIKQERKYTILICFAMDKKKNAICVEVRVGVTLNFLLIIIPLTFDPHVF